MDGLDVLLPQVRSYFIHQKGDMIDISIQVAPGCELADIRDGFLREIMREYPDLDASKFRFSHLDRERLTIAGKRKYVLRE